MTEPTTIPLPQVLSQANSPPRLLDQVRLTARQRGHSEQAAEALTAWGLRFILFHGKRHPREMGLTEGDNFWSPSPRRKKTRCGPWPLAAMRSTFSFAKSSTWNWASFRCPDHRG